MHLVDHTMVILAHVQIIIQTMTEQKRHVMLLFDVDVGLCTYVH